MGDSVGFSSEDSVRHWFGILRCLRRLPRDAVQFPSFPALCGSLETATLAQLWASAETEFNRAVRCTYMWDADVEVMLRRMMVERLDVGHDESMEEDDLETS